MDDRPRRPADASPLPTDPPPADPPPVADVPPTPSADVGDIAEITPPVSPQTPSRPTVADVPSEIDVLIVEEPAPVASAPPVSTLPAPVRQPSPTLAATPEVAPEVAPESRMLPPHQTKVERVADHVAAISADLREWTELQIALVKRQVQDALGFVDRLKNLLEAAKLAIPGAVLILIGLFFSLLTLAFAIGALIDSVWGGFAIVTALLLIIGGVLVWLGKRRFDDAEAASAEAERRERAQELAKKRAQQGRTRAEVEDEQRRAATLSAS